MSIFVDDTSSLISYQGPWAMGDTTPLTNIPVFSGLKGPFNDTIHALSGSGSFSFFFSGSNINVVGSLQNSSRASWTCFIDGNALIPNVFQGPYALNNAVFCDFNTITGSPTLQSPSNLTVVSSGTSDSPFLFDYISYTPFGSDALDNATVAVSNTDSQIHYSSGWSMGVTSVGGSFLTIDFVGIQITWISGPAILQEGPNGTVIPFSQGSAVYSIDNGTLFPFLVPAQNLVQAFNLQGVSFQSPVLSPGSHSLFVQYSDLNKNGSAPLTLDDLFIQNLTIPSFTPSPTITSTPSHTMTSTPSPTITETDSPGSGKLSAGTLSGIVIGSLVGGALITLGLIWVIRFIKRKSASDSDSLRRPDYGAGQDTY